MFKGALEGIRVTEFNSAWAGPYATCLLGSLGAEVIKIESRKRIDHSRRISFSTQMKFDNPDTSTVFNQLNLNKLSVTLNLSKPEGIEISKRLVKESDVVMENMRPGVMTRLGLGYEVLREVKPDIIYISSSTSGQVGPNREYVGYAPSFAAFGGFSYITGYEDYPPTNYMGSIDLRSASTSAFSIIAALIHRQKTGEGQHIDMSSQESIAIMIGDVLLDYSINKNIRMRKANWNATMAPHNCYRCLGDDKWISIAVADDQEWQALCQAMEKPELARDDRFSDLHKRQDNIEELDKIINDWTRDKDYYDVMEQLQNVGVAAAPSLDSEGLSNDPHVKERGFFKQVEHPSIGNTWVLNLPWKLSETPADIHRHSPLLGEHNDYVFKELLGMSQEEIKSLEEKQAIY